LKLRSLQPRTNKNDESFSQESFEFKELPEELQNELLENELLYILEFS